MLILTRRIQQGIIIAGNIHIRVLGVERDRVKIGISAPQEVTILRDELVERDKEKQKDEGNDADQTAQVETKDTAARISEEESAKEGQDGNAGSV